MTHARTAPWCLVVDNARPSVLHFQRRIPASCRQQVALAFIATATCAANLLRVLPTVAHVFPLTVCHTVSFDVKALDHAVTNPRNALPSGARLVYTTGKPTIGVDTCAFCIIQACLLHRFDRHTLQLLVAVWCAEESAHQGNIFVPGIIFVGNPRKELESRPPGPTLN